MPRHFRGKTGPARAKALAEHRAMTGGGMSPDLGLDSPISPDLGLAPPMSQDIGMGYAPGGMSDAMRRSVTEYAGGGRTGYADIGVYKKGGKVKK
jgi:hypothetical protein